MKTFRFCPSCKSDDFCFDGVKKFNCNSCSFTYFHNVAAAAAVMLEYEGKILFIKREREPQKGKLDLPGGFIDPNESAEEGLNRELKEELGISLEKMDYIGSSQNTYEYKGVIYNTCDLLFYSKIDFLPNQIEKSEIAAIELIDPNEINKNDIAFISTQKGIELLLKSKFH